MKNLVEIEFHEKIAEVALNRPGAFNALNLEMLTCLAEELTHLAGNGNVKGVVITGRGKAFCGGGDLKEAGHSKRGLGPAFHALAGQFHKAVLEIRRMKKPVVAAINGAAAGGGFSLALACDYRVMAKSALLKQAYTSAGLCIDGGGTFHLPRLVGLSRAMEIVAFDEPISAELALSWGLVNKVAEDGQSMSLAMEMANTIAKGSLFSFAWSKRLLLEAYNTPLETQMEHERIGLMACGSHSDGQEGVKAFIEKRKPKFKGH